jgi:hypothetical protein
MNMRKLIAGMITTLSVLAAAACSAGPPVDRAGGRNSDPQAGHHRPRQP